MELEYGLVVRCEGCGANLTYNPDSTHLTCRHCDHVLPIPDPEGADQANEEFDFYTQIEAFEDTCPRIAINIVKCVRCGAETQFDAHQQSGFCSFCDTPIVLTQSRTKQVIKPKGILPFSIGKKQAIERYKSWLNALWFAPDKLKKQITRHEKFSGIYLPFWTYDCTTHTAYRGERGVIHSYTITETDDEGKSRTRTKYYTRWSSASGTVSCVFNDVLICATTSIPTYAIEALEPWNLDRLVDYKDEYLSGFIAESYQIDLKSGYGKAEAIMDQHIRYMVKRDIGGAKQRIHDLETKYQAVTFKHCLLPVWVSAFRYRDELYQIVINARTGKIHGERPYSWIKLTLAVLIPIIVLLCFIFRGHICRFLYDLSG